MSLFNIKKETKITVKKAKGYTLIELLASVAIFALIIAGPAGFFVAAVRAQNRALVLGQMVESSPYSLEYMSRALRMARKDMDGDCVGLKKNYATSTQNPLDIITFLKYDENSQENVCHQFAFGQGKIQERICEVESFDCTIASNWESWVSLTPNGLAVSQGNFFGSGWNQTDNIQPRVTIFYKIATSGQPVPSMSVETTVSQRNLDIQY